jgi:hypothetical protein
MLISVFSYELMTIQPNSPAAKKLLFLHPEELVDRAIYPDLLPVIVPNNCRNVTHSL